MSVSIYEDEKSSEIVVQSTAITVEDFMMDFAGALNNLIKAKDPEFQCYQVLQKAMPIAFKLAGYKADEVREQRSLVCGNVSPEHCKVIGHGGKE